MTNLLPLAPSPELVFGLVAPIGVDLDLVTQILADSLKGVGYNSYTIRLTKEMREIETGKPLRSEPFVQSYRDRIAYANEVRRLLGDEALATLAISAIRNIRQVERTGPGGAQDSEAGPPLAGEGDEEAPLIATAYIIRQLKRPEEVSLLRAVYGRQFILISTYAPQDMRVRRIADRQRDSTQGLVREEECRNEAFALVNQDAREERDEHGQDVRDVFPLGDAFIDASSRDKVEATLRRFVDLLFGSNAITPTHDEYGMYLAKSASLRSSDLSRQVGAAIFGKTGELITLGCNEVPKAGGGTYWASDVPDGRDMTMGYDPNERSKREILVDILNRLKLGGHLSPELNEMNSAMDVANHLMRDSADTSVSGSRVMDLLEFGRAIHAEMSAICDAARKGVSVNSSTLFCTTFPCHICAKHIVAAGISEVVYIEPYPKSYASDLHRDSISEGSETGKVQFRPFLGISPFRYRDLFEKGKRKYSSGQAQRWNRDSRRPMIDVYYPSYFLAETFAVGHLRKRIEDIVSSVEPPASF